MIEIWKDIPDYEGIYQVSNLGNIKSLSRTIKHSKEGDKVIKEKHLKQTINKLGYYYVGLCKKDTRKFYKTHQLVAMAFLNHRPCGMELVIDHINDIKTDNRLENLQIATSRFNTRKTRTNCSSQYKGVSWHKRDKIWRVRIWLGNERKNLGSFKDEHEAHLCYQNALREYINKRG